MFTTTHPDRCAQIMRQVCGNFEAELAEFHSEDNHIHLLVTFPPKVTLSTLVNSPKGVSSRLSRTEFEDLRVAYWKGVRLWPGSYSAGPVDGAPLSVLREYIEQQTRPSR